jgi:hemerythrin superfamily protein
MSVKADGPNAVTLLKADHRAVDALLKEFEGAHEKEKQDIAELICDELTVHAQIEEELLYPAAREALGADDVELVNEADVEHEGVRDLIAKIQESSPEDEHFDAMVTVLGEYVRHHVKEEETELFPRLKDSDIDLDALGAQLAARKTELSSENEDEDDDADSATDKNQ